MVVKICRGCGIEFESVKKHAIKCRRCVEAGSNACTSNWKGYLYKNANKFKNQLIDGLMIYYGFTRNVAEISYSEWKDEYMSGGRI